MPRTYLTDVKILADNLSPYQTEPVSVDEVKLAIQMEGTAYDAPLTLQIKAARKKIEKYCNVSLVSKSILASFTTVGLSTMKLPRPMVDEIVKVEWKECPTTWLELTVDDSYEIVNDESLETEILSSEIGKHRIHYITHPIEDISIYQQAIIMQAGYMFMQRDNPTAPEWNTQVQSLLEESRLMEF